jgi:transcriptional regulator with XRE-family HTH domain
MYIIFMSRKTSKKISGFGTRVREIRQRKGVSQVELAKRLGVTQRGISYYENEANNPSMDVIDKIAAALGVSKRMLIEYSDEPLEDEPKAIRSLQQRLKIIPKLPPEGQKYLVETIDMLAGKHGVTIAPE